MAHRGPRCVSEPLFGRMTVASLHGMVGRANVCDLCSVRLLGLAGFWAGLKEPVEFSIGSSQPWCAGFFGSDAFLCTRARDFLMPSGIEPASEFLENFKAHA